MMKLERTRRYTALCGPSPRSVDKNKEREAGGGSTSRCPLTPLQDEKLPSETEPEVCNINMRKVVLPKSVYPVDDGPAQVGHIDGGGNTDCVGRSH